MPDQKPIERKFPISEVNRIAEREAHAKRYYRPVYTMHKWWARRLGSVFRTIALYALTDEETLARAEAEVGADLLTFEKSEEERIWDLYLKDAQVGKGKVVLDPMMGGGTSIVEALRLGADVIGCDLNPVAWFVVKKEIEPVDLDVVGAARVVDRRRGSGQRGDEDQRGEDERQERHRRIAAAVARPENTKARPRRRCWAGHRRVTPSERSLDARRCALARLAPSRARCRFRVSQTQH